LKTSAAQLLLAAEHLVLGGGQHAVEAAQDGEAQDHVLVLAALEGVSDEVRDLPEEADDLAMVHLGLGRLAGQAVVAKGAPEQRRPLHVAHGRGPAMSVTLKGHEAELGPVHAAGDRHAGDLESRQRRGNGRIQKSSTVADDQLRRTTSPAYDGRPAPNSRARTIGRAKSFQGLRATLSRFILTPSREATWAGRRRSRLLELVEVPETEAVPDRNCPSRRRCNAR
jgi:hypothetical protein